MHHKNRSIMFTCVVAAVFLLNSCAPATNEISTSSPGNSEHQSTETAAPATSALIPTPQPTATQVTYGPDQTEFPAGINPLSGLPVTDPSLLKTPAMLISVSNFPATARPQAGLSFAPMVFEFSITEGADRFLAVFYGENPAPEIPIVGDCNVRKEPFQQTGTLLGNRVWLDKNKNGIQDVGEPGIGGVCVNLYDASNKLIQQTTTDTNGYYGFNVQSGQTYTIEFVKPATMDFTQANVGDNDHDSDANPSSGRTQTISMAKDDLSWDAGLVPNDAYAAPTPDPKKDPKAEVGPVRSGRLLYAYIANFFQDSCLIYAFASPEVLARIPKCSFVTHEVSAGGAMLTIDRMKAIADENMRHSADKPFNYASNIFSDQVPSGGVPASQLNVFFASLNQSGWTYDPLYRAWLRSVDNSDPNSPGVLHLDTDRLTGRQLHMENLIVIMADTDVVSPTNIDIHLDPGSEGYAFLFRDGQMFKIKWDTRAGDYEKKTGYERPIKFVNFDGSPAALKPGHTWMIVVTPFSTFKEGQPGIYQVLYAAPEGEAR
ncbi:MAG: DUF3048 C-terminal domain-containing protein [Chloroflexi bacterium]|nr:DUF3048 C-terminal domain-containing protein [Chloroflexota bacterium]